MYYIQKYLKNLYRNNFLFIKNKCFQNRLPVKLNCSSRNTFKCNRIKMYCQMQLFWELNRIYSIHSFSFPLQKNLIGCLKIKENIVVSGERVKYSADVLKFQRWRCRLFTKTAYGRIYLCLKN